MSTTPRKYHGPDITITYDIRRCIHAAECIKLRSVFDPDRKPWVNPGGAPVDDIKAAIDHCPSGALQYETASGAQSTDQPTAINTVRPAPDGPLYVRGRIVVLNAAGEEIARDTRIAFCRCGASGNKPYCDGSHTESGFTDPGICTRAPAAADRSDDHGLLQVTVARDGPLLPRGTYRLIDATGAEMELTKGAWCRCGGSENKPFCDGTHKRIGFTDDA